MLHYLIEINDAKGHYYDVRLQMEVEPEKLKQKNGLGLNLKLPAWIPGSYLIREFARHIISIKASINQQPCTLNKISKDEWHLPIPFEFSREGHLLIECQWRVYAWDLSVRGAHLDESHAFFNGTSLFLAPLGFEHLPIEMQVRRNSGCSEHAAESEKPWLVACGLPRVDGDPTVVATLNHGESVKFKADNYDCLIDHPFEAGELQVYQFEASGVPHYFAVYGADDDLDLERICKDLKPVCEAQIRLFEPETEKAPFEQYWFMLHATDNGYGGLEHRNSTALVCARKDLPQKGVNKAPEDYDVFMGLCSHEYFHSWNVKRIKPAAFTPYRLEVENYTRLLWVFEGFTSYYDDLILARVGQIEEKTYLKRLAKAFENNQKGPGHTLQSVAESSFEAWSKYYRQDENAPNAIVSYYTKGALVAFCLDAMIRQHSGERKSLDDVMRLMWERHGKTGKGIEEFGIPELIREATGVELSREIQRFTESCEPLPFEDCIRAFGYELDHDPKEQKVYVGMQGTFSGEGYKVKQVFNGGPAHAAGISAGDMLVAAGNRKMTETTWKRLQKGLDPGQPLRIIGFRAEKLLEFNLVTGEPKAQDLRIEAQEDMDEEVLLAPWKESA